MTNFDIITIVVILIFTTISFFKGGIGSILSLAKWYGAGVLSVMFYPEAKQIVEGMLGKSVISSGIAVFSLYVIALLALYMVTKVILLGLKGIIGGVGDRLIGLIIGFTIGLIIISSAHYAFRSANNNEEPEWLIKGKTYELTKFGADNLGKVLSGDVPGMLEDFGLALNKKKEETNEVTEKGLKDAQDTASELSEDAQIQKDLNVEKIRKSLEELKAQGLSKEEAKKKLEEMIEKGEGDFRSFDDEVKTNYDPIPE